MSAPEAARDAPNVVNAAVAPAAPKEPQRQIEMSDTHHNNVVTGIHFRASEVKFTANYYGIDEISVKKRKRISLDTEKHESESESSGTIIHEP
jgi:hypothetical protein